MHSLRLVATRCHIRSAASWSSRKAGHVSCIDFRRQSPGSVPFGMERKYYSYNDGEHKPGVISHQPEATRLRLLATGSLNFSSRSRPRVDKNSEYAILSHTWRRDGNEISFEDMKNGDREELASRPAWEKIEHTNRQAEHDGIDSFWIDSCCIDKTSSAELSEAINSMYDWYENAKVCYVYLDDYDFSMPWAEFRCCRWFTRAWCLQELLAPRNVKFYDRSWNYVGSLKDETLVKHVSTATGIDLRLLKKELTLEDFSVAQRMSWAAHRTATRVEDLAYALMGLFDVHMPMLYGEGRRSFIRLQEEIIATSTDHSIFCWQHHDQELMEETARTLLASSPAAFAGSSDIVQRPGALSKPYQMTNTGLEITLPLHSYFPSGTRGRTVARLNCFRESRPDDTIGLDLQRTFDLDTNDAYWFRPWLSAYRSRGNQFWDVYLNRRFDWQFVSGYARRGFAVGHPSLSSRLRSCPTSDRDFRTQTVVILRRPMKKTIAPEVPASIVARAFEFLDPAASMHRVIRACAAVLGLSFFFMGIITMPWVLDVVLRRSGFEVNLVRNAMSRAPSFESYERPNIPDAGNEKRPARSLSAEKASQSLQSSKISGKITVNHPSKAGPQQRRMETLSSRDIPALPTALDEQALQAPNEEITKHIGD